MSNNKQTAVEWLHDNLTKVWYDVKSSKDLLEQAKAIEKEQIIEAYEQGSQTYYDLNLPINGDQYYNETYGGE